MRTGQVVQGKASVRLLDGASEWVIPVAAVSVVFVMLVPLPTFLMDLLLAISITASVLVLLAAINVLRPVQFSVFPSLLLLLTLFRLSLNLASSRRILLHGNEGAAAAGNVIEAFGQFVVGGNYVVGFVLFIALIAIQYMVVSHGAVRTAEVTARFTLDAMPGKQMAIDADLNAGIIDEVQARARREQVAREAEFYGAMDGAARFNQRDSLATILITAINIVAGFLIGVFQLDIPFQQALKTYTILTVGDGLVTMIPSLLVSVSGGIVITRAASQNSLGKDLGEQLLSQKRPLQIAAGVMALLAVMPGMPKLIPVSIAIGLLLLARTQSNKVQQDGNVPEGKADSKAASASAKQEALEALIKLDDISVELGSRLVPLADERQGGELLHRVRALRRHLAIQMGFIVPAVHITDNVRLKSYEYLICLRGVEVSRWEVKEHCLLAISSGVSSKEMPGTDTREPAFGVGAKWIDPSLQERALAAGYAVVDQTAAIATHLGEVLKTHAQELLTRQETKRLLDKLAESHPKLVEELVPKLLTLGEVQKVLQQLLREQVPIRDLGTILESMVETAAVSKHPVLLVEAARQAIGRALVRPLVSEDGVLRVLTVESTIEEEISRALNPQAANSAGTQNHLQPSIAKRVLDQLKRLLGEHVSAAAPVLLCSTPVRFHLRRLLEPFMPKVVVLSPGEIPSVTNVQSIGVVR